MPLRNAEISRHAWLRFLKRWEGQPPECYRTELDRLISVAEPEDLGYGAVLRLMQNNMEPAKYFTAEGWRFVTNEDVTRIMTIERPYHKANRPNKKFGRQERYGK